MSKQTGATSGTLRLEIVEARLTRDTDFFSKMDPYCVIETRMQKVKTNTLNGAGKTPKWNQTFDIDVKYLGDDMKVTVWDEDVTTSDHVGATEIKISSLCVNKGLDEWFSLQHKGKKAGTIHLKGRWIPNQPGAAQAAPQMNMGQQHVMGMFGGPPPPMGMYPTAQPMGMAMGG
jgi:Ca2+-dependent lipid-binding protein